MTEHRLTSPTSTRRAHDVFVHVEEAADVVAWEDRVAALCGDIDAESHRLLRLLERGA